MAYTEEPKRDRGNLPTAAMLQGYAANCTALLATIPPTGNQMSSHSDSVHLLYTSNVLQVRVNYYQWLYYESSSDKVSATLAPYLANKTIGDPVSLPAAPAGAFYDLTQVSWLVYGRVYQISDCHFAFEVPEFA